MNIIKLKKTLKETLGTNHRVYPLLRLLFIKPSHGKHYVNDHSPDLNLTKNIHHIVAEQASKHFPNRSPNTHRFLDVGGRNGRGGVRNRLAKDMSYFLLDIEPQTQGENILTGDICDCPQLEDQSFDFIYSNNVFEHIRQPWKAAQEIGRILKPGGLCVTIAPFSWRYHPSPSDYYRYTHAGLESLFEDCANLETIESGYDITDRRGNFLGGKVKNNRDGVPCDGYGGWLENWNAFHIGVKKPE